MPSPCHVHDSKGLAFLLEDMAVLDKFLPQLISIFGDKGYVGQDYALNLKRYFGVEMLALSREYDKDLPPSAYNELVGKARKIIETTISLFSRSFNAETTFTRSIAGFATNLIAKVTAFNLANYLNMLLARPVLHISSFVN